MFGVSRANIFRGCCIYYIGEQDKSDLKIFIMGTLNHACCRMEFIKYERIHFKDHSMTEKWRYRKIVGKTILEKPEENPEETES